jgi:hypothetical protein
MLKKLPVPFFLPRGDRQRDLRRDRRAPARRTVYAETRAGGVEEDVTAIWGQATFLALFRKEKILLKNPMNASTMLSMNGKYPMISTVPPFVLRLSKDERRVFQRIRKVACPLFQLPTFLYLYPRDK